MTTTVTYAYGLPLPGGEIDYPVPDAFPIGVSESTNPRALEGTTLMVAATLMDPDSRTPVPDYPMPGAEIDHPDAGVWYLPGERAKYYIAEQIGITTKPTDTPENTVIPGKLANKLNYQDSLFGEIDPLQGEQAQTMQAGRGVIRLTDVDGGLDDFAPMSWDGAQIEIYRGRWSDPRSEWEKISRMTASGIIYDEKSKVIKLRDASWRLQSEIQPARYGGSGGLDGDPVLRGAPKPYGIGYVNRAPVLTINAALLIGQLSNSSVYSVESVQDGGVALTFSADYATYALLAAATVAPGYYATCKAFGLIRLGATPTKQVTCTFCGDNDIINGKSYPHTRAEIIRRLACGIGTGRLSESEDLDQPSFTRFDNSFTDEIGYYWNQPISRDSAIREVISGVSGYYGFRFDGRMIIGAMELPTSAPFLTLTYGQNIKSMPRMVAYSPPRLGTIVGFERNYTVQTRDQLQTSVPEASALIYSQPMQSETAMSGANSSIYPTSQIVMVNGGFRYQSAARFEATRQQAIFGSQRKRWQIEVPMDLYSPVLGKVVKVDGWGRYDFSGGKLTRCVGVTANDNMNLTLDLWG